MCGDGLVFNIHNNLISDSYSFFMTKDNLQNLEDKIRELVPELMKLSFGCRVFNKLQQEIHFVCGRDKGRIFVSTVWDDRRTYEYTLVQEEDEFEILGYPITLDHCRVALRRYNGIPDMSQCLGTDEANLCQKWLPLQLWESQIDVHAFLFTFKL